MKSDGTIDLVCFDAEGRQPIRMDAEAYLRAVAECDAALFAFGSDPGTVYGSGRNATTFTLKEWEQAIKLSIPVYLILSHRLSDSFINNVKKQKDEEDIWRKLCARIPDKYIITFDENSPGDLALQVSLTIASYLSKMLSLHCVASASWVRQAYSNLFKHLTTHNAATELQDSLSELRDEVGPDTDQNAVHLIALAYTLRRLAPSRELVSGLADSWLGMAWLLTMGGDKAVQDIKNLASNPSALCREISKWQDPQGDLSWFSFLPESDRALIMRWLWEKGLVHRYKWDFASEVETDKFALKLADNVDWKLGTGLQGLQSRFYEVYLASLAYENLLKEYDDVQSFITKNILNPPGTGAEGRILQLRGLCQAILDNPSDGIRFYERAIEEFRKHMPKLIRNIAHSHVMIAAMKADGKSSDEVKRIKSEYIEKIEKETGVKFDSVVNSFFQEVWRRIDRADFKRIWAKK